MTDNSAAAATTALGPNHGYCLDGDFVHLNADVSLASADLSAQRWALQLWASEKAFAGKTLSGIKVAELALQPMAGNFNVGGCVAALPPAGNGDLHMALALVGEDDGGVSVVADLATYPSPQQFSQPQLVGTVDCRLADEMAELTLAEIANPRSADNLSGTLALEVWALEQPYAGGAWAGMPVASVILGQLTGGETWRDVRYTVPAATAPAGSTLTVMLREWTPSGYVTRDYRNLAGKPVAVAPVLTAAPVQKTAAVAKAVEPIAKPVVAAKAANKPAAAAGTVSVNTASAAELAAVKGMSKTVAKAIIEARPYAKLDDVLRAKGVGAKLLDKLRKYLTV